MLGKYYCVDPPIGCGRGISVWEFSEWEPLTFREYQISGWCDNCQDAAFGEEEDE